MSLVEKTSVVAAPQWRAEMDHAVGFVRRTCELAGPFAFVAESREDLRQSGILDAVHTHDTPAIFDWLVRALSFQGISDAVASGHIEKHGSVAWAAIGATVRKKTTCPKLLGYWTFHGCRYTKSVPICAEPDHMAGCPLPKHPLRNGHLNQMAHSLYFFIRDAAQGDLVAWVDDRLAGADVGSGRLALSSMRASLLDPLRHVYGVSDKVLSMALSMLLIGAGGRRWFEVGASFVVVDTLVHNFLHRTGILQRAAAEHSYGPKCYGPGGCAEILAAVAEQIDAREFSTSFPAVFPRFVQLAVWRYCSQEGLNECNGNRIDDRRPCENIHCRLLNSCDRVSLSRTNMSSSRMQ